MIHPCDKLCGNKTASGYCATTACINPQYSNIGTAQYGQGVQKRIITNADRIRAMGDEELAKHLVCEHTICTREKMDCNACMLDWLQEEVKDVKQS